MYKRQATAWIEALATRAPSSEALASAREQCARALGGVDRLGSRYGEVFTLRYAMGCTETEIARATGLSLAAVKTRVAEDPELVELADVIVGAQRRLLAMVDAIRDFTAGPEPALAKEPVDLVTIVDDALALLRHDPDVRRRQVQRVVTGHPLCLAHRGKLAQVVINLVHNAALATAAGAAIEVAVREAAGGVAELTVTDRGEGMAPAVVARLGGPRVASTRAAPGRG